MHVCSNICLIWDVPFLSWEHRVILAREVHCKQNVSWTIVSWRWPLTRLSSVSLCELRNSPGSELKQHAFCIPLDCQHMHGSCAQPRELRTPQTHSGQHVQKRGSLASVGRGNMRDESVISGFLLLRCEGVKNANVVQVVISRLR